MRLQQIDLGNGKCISMVVSMQADEEGVTTRIQRQKKERKENYMEINYRQSDTQLTRHIITHMHA